MPKKPLIFPPGTTIRYREEKHVMVITDVSVDTEGNVEYATPEGAWYNHASCTFVSEPTLATLKIAGRDENEDED